MFATYGIVRMIMLVADGMQLWTVSKHKRMGGVVQILHTCVCTSLASYTVAPGRPLGLYCWRWHWNGVATMTQNTSQAFAVPVKLCALTCRSMFSELHLRSILPYFWPAGGEAAAALPPQQQPAALQRTRAQVCDIPVCCNIEHWAVLQDMAPTWLQPSRSPCHQTAVPLPSYTDWMDA